MNVDRFYVGERFVIVLMVVIVCGCGGSLVGRAVFEHRVTEDGVAKMRAWRGLSEEAAREAYAREYTVNYDGTPFKKAVELGTLIGVGVGCYIDILLLGFVWKRGKVGVAKARRMTTRP